MKQPRSKGFTLIELLVVIAILGILGAVVYLAIGTSPTREARDARRVQDIDQLRLALELYQKGKGEYPLALQVLKDEGLISNVPIGPLGDAYFYAVRSDQAAYHLGARIENIQPLSYLQNDADFRSDSPPSGETWLNGFDGRDIAGGGSANTYDIHS